MKKQCWTATLFEVFVAKKSILWNLALWSLHWRFGRKAVCSRYSCGEQLAVKGRLEECVHPMINDERRFINSLYFVKWYTDDYTYTVYICMYIYIYKYIIHVLYLFHLVLIFYNFLETLQWQDSDWLPRMTIILCFLPSIPTNGDQRRVQIAETGWDSSLRPTLQKGLDAACTDPRRIWRWYQELT